MNDIVQVKDVFLKIKKDVILDKICGSMSI